MDSGHVLKSDAPELPLPRGTLGGFTLVSKIASGGMATVYLGHKRGPNGAVQVAAIKVMLPQLVNDDEFVEMFFDEARLTSSIKHPYVCKVLDYGVEDGFHYLATEYVLGETWADLVEVLHKTPKGRAVAPLLFSHIVAQACEGLHAVHETQDERGRHLAIVHRDISPQNIMICYDGTVRVLDFGIASAAERLHETRNGVLKGHLAYMAPEQMQIQVVDRRCDVWSLGVMLWEGVTGRRLFKRPDTRITMYAVSSGPLTPLLRDGAPEVDPSLMAVIERCVVRDPNARFATAHDMGTELASLSLGATNMTSVQVASWMRHLLAERFEEKRQLLRAATDGTDEFSSFLRSGVRLAGSPVATAGSPERDLGASPPSHDTRGDLATRHPYLQPFFRAASAVRLALHKGPAPMLLLGVIACGLCGELISSAQTAPALNLPHAAAQSQRSSTGAKPAAGATAAPAGVLEVRASGAQVRVELEGRALGTTPLRVELAPGRHMIRLVPDGEEVATKAQVVIESGAHYLMEVEHVVSTGLATQ